MKMQKITIIQVIPDIIVKKKAFVTCVVEIAQNIWQLSKFIFKLLEQNSISVNKKNKHDMT